MLNQKPRQMFLLKQNVPEHILKTAAHAALNSATQVSGMKPEK